MPAGNQQPVKNQDLWERLDELRETRKVDWRWIKYCSGQLEHECADAPADRGIDELGEGGCDK